MRLGVRGSRSLPLSLTRRRVAIVRDALTMINLEETKITKEAKLFIKSVMHQVHRSTLVEINPLYQGTSTTNQKVSGMPALGDVNQGQFPLKHALKNPPVKAKRYR